LAELAAADGDAPLSLRGIADRLGLSFKYLEFILRELKKAGYIASTRGASGGYFLRVPAGQITFAEVVKTLDGSIGLLSCLADVQGCPNMRTCLTRRIWAEAEEALYGSLARHTIADLVPAVKCSQFNEALQSVTEKSDQEDSMPKKIMVVDDDPNIVDYLVSIFRDAGYETCSAPDGSRAMEVLERERPDLLTLDLEMPEEWGPRFYRKFSQKKEFDNLPVIVISGLSGIHLAIRKAVATVNKPFDPAKVLEVVENTIGKP
jgi:Rrf2 family protein